MKIPTFAALCLMATMSLGCGAAEEQDEGFDSFSEELSNDKTKGKEDDGKGKGGGKGHHGPAFLVCTKIECKNGDAIRAKIVAAVEKSVGKLAADPKKCFQQLMAAKDKLKGLQDTIGDDMKAYREACKDEIKAAHKAGPKGN